MADLRNRDRSWHSLLQWTVAHLAVQSLEVPAREIQVKEDQFDVGLQNKKTHHGIRSFHIKPVNPIGRTKTPGGRLKLRFDRSMAAPGSARETGCNRARWD